jgi:hypothetical protein
VAQHDRLQRAIGCDDGVRRGRARQHRAPERQIRGPLQRGFRGIRRAEFFETLRIQHQRRSRILSHASIAKDARAEAVHDVRAPGLHEIERAPPRPETEDRIRRAAIDYRRPPPSREREGVVRNEFCLHLRVNR